MTYYFWLGAEADRVVRAHPVRGVVDYAALSCEHMARYPAIRAALAIG
jgi:hypothetical protein